MKRADQNKMIQRQLLGWYTVYQRDLPWRRTNDPYAIWISEVMLQQTQVNTVKPYYHRFLKQFPTVEKLAQGRLQTVLKLWEGLGYYSRARNLHKGAKDVVNRFNGQLPADLDALQTIKGIGPYTSGAIGSIAFGLDAPVLDGNVSRVLCRLYAIKKLINLSATIKQLWRLATVLVPAGNASFFNQALMDLGAGVCTARKPLCETCPLNNVCKANFKNIQYALPMKLKKKSVPHYDIAVAVILKMVRGQQKVLIEQLPEKGLLGGLWKFPGGKIKSKEKATTAVVRECKELLNITVAPHEPLCVVKHAYTHFKITIDVHLCKHVKGTPKPTKAKQVKWVTLAALNQYPFPTSNQKIISKLITAVL